MRVGNAWLCALAAGALLLAADFARGDGWGDIKGQVVLAGAAPSKKELKPNKDQEHCLSKGKLMDDALLVDEKSGGLKNVMVWLAPMTPEGRLPIHPTLTAVPKENVVIDQPCCLFEPRVTMMREGQVLEIKNSAPILHNCRIMGGSTVNGTINLTIPPGRSITKQLRAERRPLLLGCDIHTWMGGCVFVCNHPYFALTKEDGTFEIKNAPAGKYKIFLRHETLGWVHAGKKATGQEIEIKAGGTLNLGKYETKPE